MMWMECSTQTGSLVHTTERSMNLLWVSTTARMVNCCSSSTAARSAIGAAQDTLLEFLVVGVLLAMVGRDRKVEETQG